MQEAYQIILTDARDFANHDPRKPWFLIGDFFFLPDRFDSFALHYDPDQLRAAIQGAKADENETLEVLKQIVHDSIAKAMNENPGMVGGLILDEVRRATS